METTNKLAFIFDVDLMLYNHYLIVAMEIVLFKYIYENGYSLGHSGIVIL